MRERVSGNSIQQIQRSENCHVDEKCSGADYAAEFLRRAFVSDGTEKDGSADVSVDDSSAFGELCLKPRKRLHMAGYGDLSSADRAEPASVPRRGYRIFQHVLYHSVFRGSRFYSGHPYQRFVQCSLCVFYLCAGQGKRACGTARIVSSKSAVTLSLLILVYCRNCVYYYVFYSAVLGGKRKKPAGSGTQNP